MTQHDIGQRKTPFNQFVYTFFSKILRMIMVNILFLLTSIPLFTIPSSYAAMQKVMIGIVTEKENPSIFKDYFKAFQKNFIISTLFGWISLVILSGLSYGVYFYYVNSESILFLVFSFFCMLLFFIIYAISMYGYQMMVSVQLSFKDLIKNSVILTLSYPLITLVSSLGSFLILLFGIGYFPYTVPLVLLILFSFSCYFSTFISFSVIQKNIIQ
jgi:uncharacterized membrane protein YesL